MRKGGLWRSGKTLVAAKDAPFPDRCVVCAQTNDLHRVKRRLYWHHPAIFLTLLAGALVPCELDVEAPIEALVFVVRGHVLELRPVSVQAARALVDGERHLETELPVAAQAVGVFRHDLQRRALIVGLRPGAARLVDVNLERVLAVASQLIREHLDLVRRGGN